MSLTAASGTKAGRLNRPAVTAIVLAVIAVAGFFLSMGVLAVLAVSAGHVALNQIRQISERGRGLAIAALGIGYAIGTRGLFTTLSFLPGLLEQSMGDPCGTGPAAQPDGLWL